jgi:hypothetical protein
MVAMIDKGREKQFTVLAIFCIVAGWVILSNLPHHSEGSSYSRTNGVDYTDWQPWTGIVLLSAGISYFVLTFPRKG